MNISDIKKLPPEKLLVLVDGSSYLFRAFYAPNLRDLTSPSGTPTGAIYGVINMLLRLTNSLPILANSTTGQCFSAMVFDAKGGSFRNQIYPDYKANRKDAPDDLVSQIFPLHKIIRAQGWQLLCESNVEADDVIATLTKQAKALGLTTIIVTGDKDFAQIVDEQTFLFDTMKDEWLDCEGVKAKFGVPPERIHDYLTLIGDTSDNIPGVEKVGAKTAVKWLSEYGSLANLIINAEKITGVVGENFRKAIKNFPLTQKLITLKEDVVLPLSLSELKVGNEDTEKLKQWFGELGFKRFLAKYENESQNTNSEKKLPSATGDESNESIFNNNNFEEQKAPKLSLAQKIDSQKNNNDFVTINSWELFDFWLEKIKNSAITAIDTETTGLDLRKDELVGISLAVSAKQAAYIPLSHNYNSTVHPAPIQLPLDEVLARLKTWLEDYTYKKCGHNLKFDRHFFAKYGINLAGISDDSMIFAYAENICPAYDLESCANYYLQKYGISFAEIISESIGEGIDKKNIRGVPIEYTSVYACEDAAFSWEIVNLAQNKLAQNYQISKAYQLEMSANEVLFQMESRGILVDCQFLLNYSKELEIACQTLIEKAHNIAGEKFNLSSPKQIQEILFTKMGATAQGKTAKGAISTDEDTLLKLADDYPIAKVIYEYRQLSKINNTYAQKLPTTADDHSRIHTNYNQVAVTTGRLSSNEPNLQNIPIKTPEGRKVRQAFITNRGWKIISADYSQIELRVMAHFAQDEKMLNAFSNGVDIHKRTAADIFHLHIDEVNNDLRRIAKTINFGLIYGMSVFGLAQALDLQRKTAQEFFDNYFIQYPKVKNVMNFLRESSEKNGFVQTLSGRKIYINYEKTRTIIQKQALGRFAINAPIQGTAAEIIKYAMINVYEFLLQNKLKTQLLLQVHDELVLEAPDYEVESVKSEISKIMCAVGGQIKLSAPLEVNVGVGDSWQEAH